MTLAKGSQDQTAIIGRLVGVGALGFIAGGTLVAQIGTGYFSDFSTQQIVTWATQNQQLLRVTGVIVGLQATIYVLLIVWLVALTGGRGALAAIAYIGVAVGAAMNSTILGIDFALADLAQRGSPDAAFATMFSFGKMMSYADAISLGVLAVGSVSLLLLRSHALPSALGWYGLVVVGVHVIEVPLIYSIGLVNAIGAILTLIWIGAMGVTLLVKPTGRSLGSTLTQTARDG